MLAKRGRPRLLPSPACAGYSGRGLALTWTAASGPGRAVPNAKLSDREGSKADDRAPRRNAATVQHVDHAPNSPGSGSSFTLSGIGSPSTIRARRPLQVSQFSNNL
jgi:hypothetical protein